ncbi:hypothetical protein [uncultured Croceitalea sp.]|uniref:hypothetical protein n=1 Tax=uncultured Croceitalea sp. TaxID=1798908 RepID=UPI003305C223
MRKTLVAVALLFGTISLSAQTSGQIANYGSSGLSNYSAASQINTLLGPISDANSKLELENTGIKGSPYTSNVFLPANIYYKGEDYGSLYYRYNAYNEEIEIKKQNLENEGIRALGRDKSISIRTSIEGKPMSFKTFIDKKNRTQNGYLTLLQEGKYTLYKRIDVKFTEGQKAQNSFVKATPARFSQFVEYYLEIKGKNRIDEVELKNKKLLNLVETDKKEALKSFLKESDLKLKSEENLIKAISFLNQ